MLCRFAAACVVASIAIAAGALLSRLLPVPPEIAWTMTTVWCFVPTAWGLWAMLAPAGWVPARLSAWGAILGVVAGTIVGPVLDLPVRLGAPGPARWLALLVGPILYYALWLLVGRVFHALQLVGDSDVQNRPARSEGT